MTSPCSRTNTNATTFHCSPSGIRNFIIPPIIASQPALNHHQPANFGSVGQSSSGCWKSESCQSEVSFRLWVFFSLLFSRSTFSGLPLGGQFSVLFRGWKCVFLGEKCSRVWWSEVFGVFPAEKSRWVAENWAKLGQDPRGDALRSVCVKLGLEIGPVFPVWGSFWTREGAWQVVKSENG